MNTRDHDEFKNNDTIVVVGCLAALAISAIFYAIGWLA